MPRHDVHVVHLGDDGWAVLREGDDTPVSTHASRTEAEHAGRQLAEDGDVSFELHPHEGRGDDFSDDPRDDPRG
jgi:hypothetical protein